MEASDSSVLACKTGRVSFKANKLYNYRPKLLLGIKRCPILFAQREIIMWIHTLSSVPACQTPIEGGLPFVTWTDLVCLPLKYSLLYPRLKICYLLSALREIIIWSHTSRSVPVCPRWMQGVRPLQHGMSLFACLWNLRCCTLDYQSACILRHFEAFSVSYRCFFFFLTSETISGEPFRADDSLKTLPDAAECYIILHCIILCNF